MFLAATPRLAALIPREAWDPAHHNPKWIDSYATAVTERREWPSRPWLVGLNPKTPREFLAHSLRNLTYEYNAALRSCSNFPDMITFYKEMFARGVKVDVDTMYVMLSRAARHEAVSTQELFALWDEMKSAGARPDQATTEVLHTVWDMLPATSETPEIGVFREIRRTELVATYNQLCLQETHRYGQKALYALMQQCFYRFRENVKGLRGILDTECYAAYVSYIISDTRLRNTLTFASRVPKSETSFLESIATFLTAEGTLLAMRYDIQTVLEADHFHLEIDRGAGRKENYLYSLKRIFEKQKSEGQTTLEVGVAQVYLTALRSAIERYGSNEPENQARVLFFCRLIQMDVEYNMLYSGSTEIWESLLEVYRYYGRALASRAVLRQSWNLSRCTRDLLAHYVATVDPWDERKKFGLMDPVEGQQATFPNRAVARPRTDISKGKSPASILLLDSASQEPETSHASSKTGSTENVDSRFSPQELRARYQEILEFGMRNSRNILPGDDHYGVFRVVVSLLWFLRNALLAIPSTVEVKPLYSAAGEILLDIHNLRDALLLNEGEHNPRRRTTNKTGSNDNFSSLTVSDLPGDIAGDYADMFFSLFELIALRLGSDDIKSLLELRVRMLDECRNDPRLLLAWAEEA